MAEFVDYDYEDDNSVNKEQVHDDLFDDAINMASETRLRDAIVKFLPQEKKIELYARHSTANVKLNAKDYNSIAVTWSKVKQIHKKFLASRSGTILHQEYVPISVDDMEIFFQIHRVDDKSEFEYYLKIYMLDEQGFKQLSTPLFTAEPVIDNELMTVATKAGGEIHPLRYVEKGFRLWRNDTFSILWNTKWEN